MTFWKIGLGAFSQSGTIIPMSIFVVALAVFLVNLPFGFWRSRTKRFSRQWFIAVHLPIPLSIALRILTGLGWRLSTIPIFAAAFFCGQWAGGLLEQIISPAA
jgi:hypothetical protein